MRLFLGIMLVIFFIEMFSEKDSNKARLFTYALMADIAALVALTIAR